ncbi:hypothetical protein BDQ17DRAFT_1013808 [Cyathus striatus]|nr:hypothetical protein BDQ17DRAFT_1013808 [Cyathus striatus]
MFPTVARLSKASRKPLTSKRGNKDYYKGTRQAFLPGGHRTGAPGVHVIGGKAKYRLLDEKVRVYVSPPIEDILNSPLKPYVAHGVRLTNAEERAVFGKFPGPRGLTGQHFLHVARGYAVAEQVNQGKQDVLKWAFKKPEEAKSIKQEVVKADGEHGMTAKAERTLAEASILEEVPAKV